LACGLLAASKPQANRKPKLVFGLQLAYRNQTVCLSRPKPQAKPMDASRKQTASKPQANSMHAIASKPRACLACGPFGLRFACGLLVRVPNASKPQANRKPKGPQAKFGHLRCNSASKIWLATSSRRNVIWLARSNFGL